MDDKELRKRISEVAIIKDKSINLNNAASKKHIAHEIDDFGNEIEIIETKENPTLGFEIVKLKENFKLCDLGCGDIIPNQIIEKRLCFTPESHWRTRCQTCGCYLSPDGVGFIDDGHLIAAAYMKYYNNKK